MASKYSTAALTAIAIDRMKQGDTRADTAENRGLRVTKLARDVRYWYRFSDPARPGKKVELTIGYGSQMTLAEVRLVFTSLKAQRKQGHTPELPGHLRPSPEPAPDYLVVDMIEHFLVEKIDKRRTPKSAAECRRVLSNAVSSLGGKPITAVTLGDCLDLVNEQLDGGRHAQAGVLVRELSSAIEHAITRRRLPLDFDNPASRAHTILKREGTRLSAQRRKRYLTDAELEQVLSWLPGSGFSPRQRIALELTLQTGARSGESIAAAWRDLDLERGVWSIPSNKTNTPREIALAPRTTEWLKALSLVSEGSYLCQSPRSYNHIQQKTLSESVWRMRNSGTMPDMPAWTPHDLRRTVRTGLARLRCPQPVAEALLGHAPDSLVGTYNLHAYTAEIREWLAIWNAHLDGIRAGRR